MMHVLSDNKLDRILIFSNGDFYETFEVRIFEIFFTKFENSFVPRQFEFWIYFLYIRYNNTVRRICMPWKRLTVRLRKIFLCWNINRPFGLAILCRNLWHSFSPWGFSLPENSEKPKPIATVKTGPLDMFYASIIDRPRTGEPGASQLWFRIAFGVLALPAICIFSLHPCKTFVAVQSNGKCYFQQCTHFLQWLYLALVMCEYTRKYYRHPFIKQCTVFRAKI